jgi:hypothetical protein
MNIDEQIRMMAEDNEGGELGSPIEVARHFRIRPQKIYYWLRTGKLEVVRCNCGRKCVSFESVRELVEPKVQEEEEVPGSDMDAADDERGD